MSSDVSLALLKIKTAISLMPVCMPVPDFVGANLPTITASEKGQVGDSRKKCAK